MLSLHYFNHSFCPERADNDERIFNVKKQESDVYNGFNNVKGRDRKTSGYGNKQRYY